MHGQGWRGLHQVEASLSSRLLGSRCSGGVQNLLRLSEAMRQGSMICNEARFRHLCPFRLGRLPCCSHEGHCHSHTDHAM